MPFGFFVRPSGLQRRLKSPSIPDESSPRAFFDVTISLCSCVFIVPSSNLFPKSLMYHARSAWWLETKSYAHLFLNVGCRKWKIPPTPPCSCGDGWNFRRASNSFPYPTIRVRTSFWNSLFVCQILIFLISLY